MALTLFFTPREVVLALPTTSPTQTLPLDQGPGGSRPRPQARAMSVLRLRFEGATATPALTATDPLSGSVNYLIGNDPAKWRTNLPTYAGVVYGQNLTQRQNQQAAQTQGYICPVTGEELPCPLCCPYSKQQ